MKGYQIFFAKGYRTFSFGLLLVAVCVGLAMKTDITERQTARIDLSDGANVVLARYLRTNDGERFLLGLHPETAKLYRKSALYAATGNTAGLYEADRNGPNVHEPITVLIPSDDMGIGAYLIVLGKLTVSEGQVRDVEPMLVFYDASSPGSLSRIDVLTGVFQHVDYNPLKKFGGSRKAFANNAAGVAKQISRRWAEAVQSKTLPSPLEAAN